MSTWKDLKNVARLRAIYDARLKIIRLTREFFWRAGFVEADTPIGVALPGQEPYLSPMSVVFHNQEGDAHKFYLHTSPEILMKKLLAAGYGKIFQITKCFRDFESFGGAHNPEFTMMEWYRAPGNFFNIMDDAENLFKFISRRCGVKKMKIKKYEIPVLCRWERKTMKRVWLEYLGVNLDEHLTCSSLVRLAKKLGQKTQKSYAYEDLFYLIFLNNIEPHLGIDRPIFIYDYPAQMCSLSRAAKDARYAERFELYIGGLELANAFGELTDAKLQKKSLEADRAKRKKMGRDVYDVDQDFIDALAAGIPSAGGIALGIDRMVMLFTGAKDINEVIFQSAADMTGK
jgi:lysyl-tRNA synthetase class 2